VSRSPVIIAPGLTLDGESVTFAEHGTDLETIIARAHSAAVKVKDDATAAEVNAACKMHASAWGAVLALDPQVAALTPDADPLTVGPILVAAVQRAALPCADPCALVLAVAEAARLHTLAALPKPRKVEPPERVRQRALLAVPCTVEAAGWWLGEGPDRSTRDHRITRTHGHPAPAAATTDPDAGREALNAAIDAVERVMHAEHPKRAFSSPPVLSRPVAGAALPAVRLRGGLLGRSGVTLRPAGESFLAWAAAAWRLSCASLEGPRKVAEPKASAAKIAELPVVALYDGVPTMWGDATPADLTAWLKIATPPIGPDAATAADPFIADATRKRDEAFKIEGEASDLAMVADPSWTLHDVPEAQQAHVRQLAAALIAGDARAPDFERVRDVARVLFKEKRRRKHWGSNSDRVQLWAEALLAEVKRVQRIADELKREEEARRRAEKVERSHARKRAA